MGVELLDILWDSKASKYCNFNYKSFQRTSSISASAKSSAAFNLLSASFSIDYKVTASLGIVTNQNVNRFLRNKSFLSLGFKHSHLEKTKEISLFTKKNIKLYSNDLIYFGKNADFVALPKQHFNWGASLAILSSLTSFPASCLFWAPFASQYLLVKKTDKTGKKNSYIEDGCLDIAAGNDVNITFEKSTIFQTEGYNKIKLNKKDRSILIKAKTNYINVEESNITLSDKQIAIKTSNTEMILSEKNIKIRVNNDDKIVIEGTKIRTKHIVLDKDFLYLNNLVRRGNDVSA